MDIEKGLSELETTSLSCIDPHHNGEHEYKYENGTFYHRILPNTKWKHVHTLHVTTKRIIALYSVIPKKKKDKWIIRLLKWLINKLS